MCWQRCFLLLVSRYTTAILWYILILPTLNLPTLISPTKRVFVSFRLLIIKMFYVGFECFESVGRVVLYLVLTGILRFSYLKGNN